MYQMYQDLFTWHFPDMVLKYCLWFYGHVKPRYDDVDAAATDDDDDTIEWRHVVMVTELVVKAGAEIDPWQQLCATCLRHTRRDNISIIWHVQRRLY